MPTLLKPKFFIYRNDCYGQVLRIGRIYLANNLGKYVLGWSRAVIDEDEPIDVFGNVMINGGWAFFPQAYSNMIQKGTVVFLKLDKGHTMSIPNPDYNQEHSKEWSKVWKMRREKRNKLLEWARQYFNQ